MCTEAAPDAPTAEQTWRRLKPAVAMKVTWAQAAEHGAALPVALRDELDQLRRTEREENRAWDQFSTERGHYPHRLRFATDEEHHAAQSEWDMAYAKHLTALRGVWEQQKAAVARALPLTVDDEPVDLLELLEQTEKATDRQRAGSAALSATLQAWALPTNGADAAAESPAPPSEIVRASPISDPHMSR